MRAIPNFVFSKASLECTRVQPHRVISNSVDHGWTSLLVQTLRGSTDVEPFETGATPDQLIVVLTRGDRILESFRDGSWNRVRQVVGQGSMRMGGVTNRLRWTSKTAGEMEKIHVYVPTPLFECMADEFRTVGTPCRKTLRDTLSLEDPTFNNIARNLVTASNEGAPDLYAASAGIHLVTHLLSLTSSWASAVGRVRSPGNLSKQRIGRVLEYMHHHLGQPIGLDDLACEAGVSRFHLIACFRKALGTTPYRHLIELRVREAAKLLGETELPVMDVARICGFASSTHFSSAFRAHIQCSAVKYRKACLHRVGDEVMEASSRCSPLL